METNNLGMPRGIMLVVGVLLVLFLALVSIDRATSLWQNFGHNSSVPKNTFPVSAEGKVKAVPDLATVNLGVLSRGDSASAAQTENSRKVNQIIDYMKKQGISTDDIATVQYNMYPQQDYTAGKSVISGYEVSQTVTVKVHGVDQPDKQAKLGELLAGATDNGANQVQGVSLGFNDADGLHKQAQELAVSNAKAKAQELAKAAGLKLGKLVTISSSGYAGNPIPYAQGTAASPPMAMDKAVAPNIEPGQQDIIETMTVVYELK